MRLRSVGVQQDGDDGCGMAVWLLLRQCAVPQLNHPKYDRTAAQHHAQMLAFSVETCGGMASDAVTLTHIIADAGEEMLGLWPKDEILKQLVGAVSVAVQRGNGMTFLAGYTRAMAAGTGAPAREGSEE